MDGIRTTKKQVETWIGLSGEPKEVTADLIMKDRARSELGANGVKLPTEQQTCLETLAPTMNEIALKAMAGEFRRMAEVIDQLLCIASEFRDEANYWRQKTEQSVIEILKIGWKEQHEAMLRAEAENRRGLIQSTGAKLDQAIAKLMGDKAA
jgi:hypothetical protein